MLWEACSKFHGPLECLMLETKNVQEKNVSFADLGTFSLNSYPFSPILKACSVSETFSINGVAMSVQPKWSNNCSNT